MATATYTFGIISGVNEGDVFVDRAALRNASIHLALQAGIDGNPSVGSPSIVLNGGFVDDMDFGDVIIYTGHGGNDPNTKRQISDQSWDSTGNMALIVSEMNGLPVRVTRGHKHISPYSPSTGYEYGGLYLVVEHFQEIGIDGFVICRYRLEKITPLTPKNEAIKKSLPEGKKETTRITSTILKIVRDLILTREIKRLYNHTCQVCGTRISLKDAGYSEAAHIRPLGIPHNGSDTPSNILCLCPNHHVMLDKGVFSIENNFNLIGLPGVLNVVPNHNIGLDNLDYHRRFIYTP